MQRSSKTVTITTRKETDTMKNELPNPIDMIISAVIMAIVLAAIAGIAAILTGCELIENGDNKPESTQNEPISQPQPQPDPAPTVRRDGLLKPISDSIRKSRIDGGMAKRWVIILPSWFRWENATDDKTFTGKCLINGAEDIAEYRKGYANQDRIHVFAQRLGPEYPRNTVIKIQTKDGKWHTENVGNPGLRQGCRFED